MISKRKPYNTYTKEFKLEALRLMNESDRPSSEIAAELGIRRNQLYKWKEQLEVQGGDAFAGKRGRPPKENQNEVRRKIKGSVYLKNITLFVSTLRPSFARRSQKSSGN
jgi:transposase